MKSHCEIVDLFEEDLEDLKKVHEALDKCCLSHITLSTEVYHTQLLHYR